jgi:hypothetical protein
LSECEVRRESPLSSTNFAGDCRGFNRGAPCSENCRKTGLYFRSDGAYSLRRDASRPRFYAAPKSRRASWTHRVSAGLALPRLAF